MLNRLSPTAIWTSAAAVTLAALTLMTGSETGWWHFGPSAARLVFSSLDAVAYAAGLVLCLRIAADHGESSLMRRAWLFLAASAALSLLRHLALAALSLPLSDQPDSLAGYLLTQSFSLLSMICLAAGLFLIGRTFARLDLRFAPHYTDWLLFLLLLTVVPPILLSRGFTPPVPNHPLVAAFQMAGALLLPLTTAMGIQLHRVAACMGGGAMARALRTLAIFTGLRLLMMLLNSVELFRSTHSVFILSQSIMQGAPFLFTLAAAYRWRIAEQARSAVAARAWLAAVPTR